MNEITRKYTDSFLGQMITCPVCGAVYRKGSAICSNCRTLIFGINSNSELVLIDPAAADRSKKYKVHGFVDGRRGKGFTEFFPGDIVEIKRPEQNHLIPDVSGNDYLDGVFIDIERFIMPEWDVAFTSMTSGMAMNSTKFFGPYGERLRGPYYCEENILGENEPDPCISQSSTPMMGMMNSANMMSMMEMMRDGNIAQSMLVSGQAPDREFETTVCPECKNTVPARRFCNECGAKLNLQNK